MFSQERQEKDFTITVNKFGNKENIKRQEYGFLPLPFILLLKTGEMAEIISNKLQKYIDKRD